MCMNLEESKNDEDSNGDGDDDKGSNWEDAVCFEDRKEEDVVVIVLTLPVIPSMDDVNEKTGVINGVARGDESK